MKITMSAGITATLLAFGIGCASSNVQPTTTQQPTTTSASTSATTGLERYVGEYDFQSSKVTIRLRERTLVRVASGQQERILTPIGEHRFKLGSTPAEVVFTVNTAGVVTEVAEGADGHWKRGTPVRKS